MIFSKDTIPNLLRSLSRISRSALGRQRVIASKDVLDGRIDRCITCAMFEASSRQCRKCTCFVDVKTLFAPESCPLKKWGPQTFFSKGL